MHRNLIINVHISLRILFREFFHLLGKAIARFTREGTEGASVITRGCNNLLMAKSIAHEILMFSQLLQQQACVIS